MLPNPNAKTTLCAANFQTKYNILDPGWAEDDVPTNPKAKPTLCAANFQTKYDI